jgi:hypothetical protein
MVIDIATAFNGESQSFNLEVLAPTVAHIVKVAEQHIQTTENFHDPKWAKDFDQLQKMLRFFNLRWILAGELTEDLLIKLEFEFNV